jgi:integrase
MVNEIIGGYCFMYEHRYKYGKQKEIMSVDEFREKLESSDLDLEQKAFIVLLWHTGVRKSEAYERVKKDVKITDSHVIVDFYKRKKGGEEVPPLKIPRTFYGVEEYLKPYLTKPKRLKVKTIFTYETVLGKLIIHSKQVKDRWLFPHINSTTAWRLVKKVFGERYYPHYLRLRKLSKIGKDRRRGTIIHLKSVSGIKSLRALEEYMGIDEEAQDEAMEISE